MEFEDIVVKESPGLCRCCLSEGCYKDMGSEYTWMNETEVYADMLLECFDISISQHNDGPNGASRLICEVCITRLRDACNFKKQVLDSEKKFVDMVGRGEFRPKVLIYQAELKPEGNVEETLAEEGDVEYLEEDLDFGDAEELLKNEQTDLEISTEQATASDSITVTTLPVKGKRGRPRKHPVVAKPEKRAKLDKTEEKPRSSKAVTKEYQIYDPMGDYRLLEKRRKDELTRVLTMVLENSTVMPFKWSSNKYMCFYCCCPFVDSSKLKEHTIEEHRDAKLRNALRTLIGRGNSIKLDVSDIACKSCMKPVQDLDKFLDHASEVHDFEYDKDVSTCLYSFKLSEDGMYCLECGHSFRFFGPLLEHVHKYHNKSKSYLCEVCGKAFIGKANVESHVKNMHSQSKCLKCNKKFKSHYALTNHYAKDHGAGKLKCPKCPEVLGSRYLKKRHLALVHDVKSSQFSCDQCTKVFTLKNKLVEHIHRVHLKEKTVACEICGFKVFNKDLLKRHKVKHDNSRPFKCDICKKAFQRKKTLEFHRRIHTNDRRYVCKDCGKSFVQSTSLKVHIRGHHTIDNENVSWT